MTRLIPIKCQSCGSDLEVPADAKTLFCMYCGTKFALDDGSASFTFRSVDEARIREAEIRERLEVRKMERADQRRKTTIKAVLIGIAIFLGIGLLGSIFDSDDSEESEMADSPTSSAPVSAPVKVNPKVKAPKSSYELEDSNYKDVVTLFEKAGFTNVKTDTLGDLVVGWLHKEGDVKEVSIDGETDFSKGDRFPADAKVVVRYHVYKKTKSGS